MSNYQSIGYVRVSTAQQTLDQQRDALEAAGVTKTFSDVMSGARTDRPGLAAALDYLREGQGRGGSPYGRRPPPSRPVRSTESAQLLTTKR